MANLIVAVLDNTTGKWVQREIPHTLEALQEIVGGDIEMVPVPDEDVILYCNAEGKEMGLKGSAVLMTPNGWKDVIAGTLVATGPVLGEEETDFNDKALAALEKWVVPVVHLQVVAG